GPEEPDTAEVTAEPLRPVEPLNDDHEVAGFDCGSAELDQWLARTAYVAGRAGTAATYVLCRSQRVVGYYALAMGSVTDSSAPSRLRRGMPDPVPVVVLARLALDRSEQGNKLGGHLLVDALRRCIRRGREFGARAVIVDAIDDQAVAFYHHFDFHDLEARRLWRRLTDIARALGEHPY
ncbi:MAG TPA: GNAT family N-acetyltransferase, partial [Acidimicrobiales bacterium]|nr:GNAT family N-acetyltransferase [Acidimicrobiales bacterium]